MHQRPLIDTNHFHYQSRARPLNFNIVSLNPNLSTNILLHCVITAEKFLLDTTSKHEDTTLVPSWYPSNLVPMVSNLFSPGGGNVERSHGVNAVHVYIRLIST